MIKIGGVNVAPLEVEQVLLQHPDIVQAYVARLPDRSKGEIVAAAVELRAGAATDPAAIVAFCRERLASYKELARLAFRTRHPHERDDHHLSVSRGAVPRQFLCEVGLWILPVGVRGELAMRCSRTRSRGRGAAALRRSGSGSPPDR